MYKYSNSIPNAENEIEGHSDFIQAYNFTKELSRQRYARLKRDRLILGLILVFIFSSIIGLSYYIIKSILPFLKFDQL